MNNRFGFVQVARALALNQGNRSAARQMLVAQYGAHSAVAELMARAVTDLGAIDNPESAALANVASDFVSLVRRRSIITKISEAVEGGFRRTLPYLPTLVQTSGTAAAWVGQALAIPVSGAGFEVERMGPLRVGALLVVTDELLRIFSEQADAILNRDLARALADKISATFASDEAPVDGMSPGGIFNGVEPLHSTGELGADAAQLLTGFGGNLDTSSFLTTPEIASAFNFIGGDQIGAQGGYIAGVPAVTSSAVPAGTLGLIDASRVKLIDLGVALDATRAATVLVTDGTNESVISLWQHDLHGLRAVSYCNWQLVDDDAVRWIADAGTAADRALNTAVTKARKPIGA